MVEHTADIRLEELNPHALPKIAEIPIAFVVTETALVRQTADGPAIVGAQRVVPPYLKDYDAVAGNEPKAWSERFDVANWGLIGARTEDRMIGSILIAFDTPGVEMLECRPDLAVIWDLRVRPEWRGQGVGRRLIDAAEAWARRWNCREFKVETQDINLPACRLYEACGFRLGQVRANAYRECPGEAQLIWNKTVALSGLAPL